MKGRTLGLAALAILISLTGAYAQNNLDAGKPPGRLFAETCAACHKSPRGLLKSVSGSGLPGFLRQHYTTGPEMASALAGYLMASGAAEHVPDPPARAQKQAKDGAEPSAKQKRQRAAPDADGLQTGEGAPVQSGKQKAAKKGKAGKNEVAEPRPETKPEAKPDASPESGPKPSADAQSESPKTEPEKPAEAARTAQPTPAEPAKSEASKPDQVRPDQAPAEPPADQTRPDTQRAGSDNAPRPDAAPTAPSALAPPGRVSRPAGLTLPGFPPPLAEEAPAETAAPKSAAPAPAMEAPARSEIPQIEPAKVDLGGSASDSPKPAAEAAAPAKEESGIEEVHGRAPPKANRKKNAAPAQ